MNIRKSLLALVAIAALTVPTFAASPKAGGAPVVAVSILPQQYFVQRIAGDRVRSIVLVGPGQDPHSYEPTPRQIADLSTAVAWFRIDVEFETGLLPKVKGMYPKLRIVDTTAGVKMRALGANEADPDGDADGQPGGRDPHIWMGKQGAKIQAACIRDTLSQIDPEGAPVYAANYDALIRDIDSTFDSLAKELLPLKGKPVFVYHPAFGYFLDEFGIRQVVVEVGGKEPTQKALVQLITEAKKEGAKVVFVQPQFSKSAAKTVADAIGGVVVEINALDADWLTNLKRIGDALRSSIR